MAKEYRTRNWLTIVYPESAPPDWRERLDALHIPAFISPLHEHDLNADGEVKKAHYHVVLMYDGVKTLEQVKEDVSLFGGVQPLVCKSLRGTARYLCHLDNPEKYQYSISDVISLAGADYSEAILSGSDRIQAIREMSVWCEENGVYSYYRLFVYARENRSDWFERLNKDCREDMYRFLRSFQWEIEQANSVG